MRPRSGGLSVARADDRFSVLCNRVTGPSIYYGAMALSHSLSSVLLGGKFRTLATLAAAGFTLGGCVTERVPVRPWLAGGDPAQQGPAKPGDSAVPPPGAASGTPTPAILARVSTGRARLAIEPLGTVAYDGLTLPQVAPGGQWIASQVGQVGSDAMDQQRAAAETSVIIAPVASPSATPHLIERAMLNRAATRAGVLIRLAAKDAGEAGSQVRHDLAIASWADGSLTPLADGVARAEHAIILRDGTLVTLAGEGEDQRLLLEKPGSAGGAARAEVAIPRRELAWPLATPDQRFVGVLAWPVRESDALERRDGQMELVIIAVPGASATSAAIVRRVPLSLAGGPEAAFAACASIDATPSSAVPSGWESTFMLLHTGLRRVVLIDGATGNTAQLAPGSLSASMVAGGVLIADRERLLWQPSAANRAWPGLENATRAIEKPCIPRASAADEAILLAPGPSTGVSLQILRLRLTDGGGGASGKPLP